MEVAKYRTVFSSSQLWNTVTGSFIGQYKNRKIRTKSSICFIEIRTCNLRAQVSKWLRTLILWLQILVPMSQISLDLVLSKYQIVLKTGQTFTEIIGIWNRSIFFYRNCPINVTITVYVYIKSTTILRTHQPFQYKIAVM